MPDVYLKHAVAIIKDGVRTVYEKGLNAGLSDEVAGHFMIRGATRPQPTARVVLPVAHEPVPAQAQPDLPLGAPQTNTQAADPPPATPGPADPSSAAQDPPAPPKAEEPKAEEPKAEEPKAEEPKVATKAPEPKTKK